MKSIKKYFGRFWYYFRTGYSTYLVFLIGAANTLTVLFYLLIQSVPSLQNIFPHFTQFVFFALLIGFPAAILVGWAHLKGTPAYSSEIDIQVEANPYNYKLPPGFQKEAFAPVYLEILILLQRLADREGLLASEDKSRIDELVEKMRRLLKGGYVGTPRSRIQI